MTRGLTPIRPRRAAVRLVRVRQGRPGGRRLDLDDVTAEGPEDPEQLGLLSARHAEPIQRRDQVLDEGVELAGRHLHVLVRFIHAAAGVRGRASRRRRDLIDKHRLEPWNIGPRELRVDPGVGRASSDEVVDDRRDGCTPTESFVQRSLIHRALSLRISQRK